MAGWRSSTAAMRSSPSASAFREQATADDRLWLHALGQRLAASPHASEAVAILLLAGDASGAAAVMANHGETLREKVSLAIRNEWLAALEAAGIDATLIALARDRLAFAGGLPEPHPAPVVTTLEMDFGDTERAWRRLGAVQPIAIILSLALLAAAWLAGFAGTGFGAAASAKSASWFCQATKPA